MHISSDATNADSQISPRWNASTVEGKNHLIGFDWPDSAELCQVCAPPPRSRTLVIDGSRQSTEYSSLCRVFRAAVTSADSYKCLIIHCMITVHDTAGRTLVCPTPTWQSLVTQVTLTHPTVTCRHRHRRLSDAVATGIAQCRQGECHQTGFNPVTSWLVCGFRIGW